MSNTKLKHIEEKAPRLALVHVTYILLPNTPTKKKNPQSKNNYLDVCQARNIYHTTTKSFSCISFPPLHFSPRCPKARIDQSSHLPSPTKTGIHSWPGYAVADMGISSSDSYPSALEPGSSAITPAGVVLSLAELRRASRGDMAVLLYPSSTETWRSRPLSPAVKF